MKSLQTIQKTFRVFQILAKIAFFQHRRRVHLRCRRSVRRDLVQRRYGVHSFWRASTDFCRRRGLEPDAGRAAF